MEKNKINIIITSLENFSIRLNSSRIFINIIFILIIIILFKFLINNGEFNLKNTLKGGIYISNENNFNSKDIRNIKRNSIPFEINNK